MSDEYVPTTEEIRAGLIQGLVRAARQSLDDPDVTLIRAECGRQFDAWLSAHDAQMASRPITNEQVEAVLEHRWHVRTGRCACGQNFATEKAFIVHTLEAAMAAQS